MIVVMTRDVIYVSEKLNMIIQSNAREVLGHIESVKILVVLNPTS